jgi:RNA polymerase sigma-70 factor (ECF subfamily)
MSGTPDLELLRRLERAILNLPKLQRDIFLAHRVHGLSYEEIGRRTRLSPRRVERHMAKAIYKLTLQMDGYRLSWWQRLF